MSNDEVLCTSLCTSLYKGDTVSNDSMCNTSFKVPHDAKPYTCPLDNLEISKNELKLIIQVTVDIVRDLQWFVTFLEKYNGDIYTLS